MRWRMDEIDDSLQGTLRQVDVELFKKYGIEPSALENGYVLVFACIGTEGYLIACELWERKQHCQKGTPDFLVEVMRLTQQVMDRPLLFRSDSDNDSADNIGIFMEVCFKGDQVHFIIKRNIRRELPGNWLGGLRGACTGTDARL